MKSTRFMAPIAGLLLAVCATYSTAAPSTFANGIMVGPNNMTLYTFDKDTAGSGISVCNGQCAINWPPLFALETDQAAGDYSIIKRDDGKLQWALKGKPLYYWTKDQKPGDQTGEGVGKAWWVIKP